MAFRPGNWRWVVLAALALVLSCTSERDAGQGIASLSPAITQTLVALELADQMVARSDYDTATEVTELPPVGTALTPNIEALARVMPAVIVTDAIGGQESDLGAVAEVLSLSWTTPQTLQASIRALGRRFDREDAAAELAASVESALLPTPGAQCPTVLLVLQSETLEQVWFMPRNSLHGHLVPATGGCHAIDRDIHGAAVLGPEQLLGIDPDVIVVLATRPAGSPPFDKLPSLSAVQNDRIIVLTGADLLIPGPAIVHAANQLRKAMGSVWPAST